MPDFENYTLSCSSPLQAVSAMCLRGNLSVWSGLGSGNEETPRYKGRAVMNMNGARETKNSITSV